MDCVWMNEFVELTHEIRHEFVFDTKWNKQILFITELIEYFCKYIRMLSNK
jgi:hypothetical protein